MATKSPARVAEIKSRYGLPVMKVIGVASEADLADLLEYQLVSPIRSWSTPRRRKDAVLPGGNGLTFDWRLLVGRKLAEALDAGRGADAGQRGGGGAADRGAAGRCRQRAWKARRG